MMANHFTYKYYWLFVLLLLSSVSVKGQTYIEKRLTCTYYNITNGDIVDLDNQIIFFLDSIKNSSLDITLLSDSAQYCYHYLQAGHNASNKEIMYAHFERAIDICEERIGIFDIEYIDFLCALAFGACEVEENDKAISYYQKALVKGGFLLERESNVRLRLTKGRILDNLGELYLKKGYEREAIQCFLQAHEVMKHDYEENDITTMMPLFHLGCYYDFNKKDYPKAIDVWKALIRYLEENGTYSGKYYNDWTFHLICNIAKSGDKETAYKKYKELIVRIREEFGNYSEELNSVYGNYFIILGELGYMSELEEFKPILHDYYLQRGESDEYAKALYAVSTVVKDSNKNAASQAALELEELSPFKRMLLLFNLGINEDTEVKDAIEYLLQSLSLAEELNGGRVNNECKYIFEWLSFRYYENNELSKALDANKELLSILESLGEQEMDSYFYALCRITNICFELEQYSQVLSNEEKRFSLLLKRFGEHSLEMASHYNSLAVSYMYLENYKEAKKNFNKFIKITQELMDQSSDSYNETYSTYLHNMGRLLMLQEKYIEAKDFLTESINISLKTTGKVNPKTERYLNEIESKEL